MCEDLRPRVELVTNGRTLPMDAVTDDGAVYFGISIILDDAPHTYPKNGHYFSIAVRYSRGVIQYSFWDGETLEQFEGERWTDDGEGFAQEIVKRLLSTLSSDPKDGVRERGPIGFVHHEG